VSTKRSVESALLSWLRFKRRYTHVCTEAQVAGRHRADVLALTPGHECVEFEVKRSWADYRADLNKSEKYSLYGSEGLRDASKPNRMFYAAPRELAERIRADLDERQSPYGVVAYDDYRGHGTMFDMVSVIRKARNLHGDKPSDHMVLEMAKRMSSEIANLWLGGARDELSLPSEPGQLEPLGQEEGPTGSTSSAPSA